MSLCPTHPHVLAGVSGFASAHVSVGMPVYNGERWIRSAIQSILSQDYSDLDLIISDNASTDATEDICRAFAANDPRVHYHRNSRNLGVDANYNRVAQLAQGRYFKWAAANDVCAPRFISACVDVLERRPDVVVCCPRTQLIIDDKGTREPYLDGLTLEDASPYIRFRRYLSEVQLNNVFHGVIRTAALLQTRLLRFHRCSDYALVSELALRGKFVEVPESLFFRRMTPESATRFQSESQIAEYYSPGGRRLLFQDWKQEFSYLSAVRGAPVGLIDKFRLYHYLARRLWWARGNLGRDLFRSLRALSER